GTQILPVQAITDNTFSTMLSNWISQLGLDTDINVIEGVTSRRPAATEIYTRDGTQLIEAYKLGFRLEMGEPTERWIIDAREQLSVLGPKAYYSKIAAANKTRISNGIPSNIIVHE